MESLSMSLQCLEAGIFGRPLPKDTLHNPSRRTAPAAPQSRLRLVSAYHQDASQAPRHLHNSAAPRRAPEELKGVCRSLVTSAGPAAALEQPGTDREQVSRSLLYRMSCDDILRTTPQVYVIQNITRAQNGAKECSPERCVGARLSSERKDSAPVWVQISVVMKFGGSSLASAERIREVASIICSFPEHYPCIVLSAMGKVTNNPIDPSYLQGPRQRRHSPSTSSCMLADIKTSDYANHLWGKAVMLWPTASIVLSR